MYNPICPDCDCEMVKLYYQDEENIWNVFWSCNCEGDENVSIDQNMDELNIDIGVFNTKNRMEIGNF